MSIEDAAAELLERVRSAGTAGLRLEPGEVNASYLLVRQGTAEEIAPWVLRATRGPSVRSSQYRGVLDDLTQLFEAKK